MNEKPAIKKWLFNFDQRSSGWFEDMIKVAVISARENTSLEPICLFDGDSEPRIISWLANQSVQVVRTRVPFHAELFDPKTIEANAGTPYSPEHASGAFLRLMSPDYVTDDFFLYTDCDVMFSNDPSPFYKYPEFIAACGETVSDGQVTTAQSSFNSGVMIINRNGFASRRDNLVELLRKNNFYYKKHQSYDQSMLNINFKGEWEPLAPEINWRPFQGINQDAAVIHFHGPKPHRIAAILAGQATKYEAEIMSDLIDKHRDEYEIYLRQYQRYLSAA